MPTPGDHLYLCKPVRLQNEAAAPATLPRCTPVIVLEVSEAKITVQLETAGNVRAVLPFDVLSNDSVLTRMIQERLRESQFDTLPHYSGIPIKLNVLWLHGLVVSDLELPFADPRFQDHWSQMKRLPDIGTTLQTNVDLWTFNMSKYSLILAECIYPKETTTGINSVPHRGDPLQWMIRVARFFIINCQHATVVITRRTWEVDAVFQAILPQGGHRLEKVEAFDLHYHPQRHHCGGESRLDNGGRLTFSAIVIHPGVASDRLPMFVQHQRLHIPTLVLQNMLLRRKTLLLAAWTLESPLAILSDIIKKCRQHGVMLTRFPEEH
jgi:hypothetical protein